jgi:hypothetical protein
VSACRKLRGSYKASPDFGWTISIPLVTLLNRITSKTGVLAVKQPNPLLKLAAVISSVLLAGGFVAYRAGAFNSLMEPSPQPADSESSPTSAVGDEPTGEQPALTIMPGSKSAIIGGPTLVDDSMNPPDKRARVLGLPDAKPPATSQQPPPGTTKPARRTIMGGTKSAEMIDQSQTPPPGGIQ